MSYRAPTRGEIDALCAGLSIGLSIRESCRRAGVSVHRFYSWKKEAEGYAFLDGLRAAGWSFDEIEEAVLAADRARGGTSR